MERRAGVVSYSMLTKICFFLYLCGLNGHKRGYGFDAWFCRITFIALVLVNFGRFLQNRAEGIRLNNKIFIAYFVFILYNFISCYWASDLLYALNITYINNFVQIIGVAYILDSHIYSSCEALTYIKIVLWSLIYMVILLLIRTPSSAWGNERIGEALALNANDIGIRCAIATILCVYFADVKRIYYLLAIPFILISLLSGSRKALIMVLLGIIMYFYFKQTGRKRLKNILLAMAIILFLLYLVMTNETLYYIIGRRFEAMFNGGLIGGTNRQDYSLIERAYYRKQAMIFWRQHPVFGLGSNGFATQMALMNYSHIAYSHCNYTELLCTLGIIGFILYYRIQFKSLISSIKNFIKIHDLSSLLAIIILFVNILAEYQLVGFISPFSQIIIILMSCLSYQNLHGKNEYEGEKKNVYI